MSILYILLNSYIENNIDEEILLNLLRNLDELREYECLNDVMLYINSLLQNYGYLVFRTYQEEIRFDEVLNILKLDKLIVPNETQLVKELLIFYIDHQKRIDEIKLYNQKFDEMLSYVDWNMVNIWELNPEEVNYLEKFRSYCKPVIQEEAKRKIYLEFPLVFNNKMNSIIFKYYEQMDLLLDENELKELLEYVEDIDLITYFKKTLPHADASVLLIFLVIIAEKSIKLEELELEDYGDYKLTFVSQLYYYYSSTRISVLLPLIACCLSILIKYGIILYIIEDDINVIRRFFGNDILIHIIKYLESFNDSEHIQIKEKVLRYIKRNTKESTTFIFS